jgi:hypothetical protein
MRGPPDPEMRSRPAGHGAAYRKVEAVMKPEDFSSAASDFQAEKLRRLYYFWQATAYTVASLVFAVSR